eukprot:1564095-Prymnesium_polylepis.1
MFVFRRLDNHFGTHASPAHQVHVLHFPRVLEASLGDARLEPLHLLECALELADLAPDDGTLAAIPVETCTRRPASARRLPPGQLLRAP